MAKRILKPRHQDEIRAKIQTSQIINRFYNAFNGEIELTAIQVSIGKTLLDKALPDLKSAEITGADGGDIISRLVVELVDVNGS